ncbi:uncharacterized protein B0H18DRAFT_1124331 [Fomitopsis serialis]|uniref:uncharacterized protein n=1 Tax=Fomitopsis serialis TaxID=139415 RepID=UPI002008AC33|nr:uncharacterized protein B0H18DRAFT_1124331 [Neoantrodia serialis]KAH9916345.1 hypothetical protein B0H18DRAFT_1124331 [Neoantrodia serialis]
MGLVASLAVVSEDAFKRSSLTYYGSALALTTDVCPASWLATDDHHNRSPANAYFNEILVIHVEQAFLVIEGAALVAILLSNGEQQPLDRERPVPSVSRGIDPGDVGALSDTSRALPSSSISSRSNPVDTRAEITYREESTSYLKFGTKGMNGTIVEVCPRKKAEVQEVEGHDFEAEGNAFDLIGRLPIFDPLCLDTKQMLGQARQRPVLRLSWSRGASPPQSVCYADAPQSQHPVTDDNERALFEGGSVSRTPLHCAKSKVKVKSPALEMFTKTGQMSNEEVAEAVSPGGHVTKRRAHSRPVELLESAQGAVVAPAVPPVSGPHSASSGTVPRLRRASTSSTSGS